MSKSRSKSEAADSKMKAESSPIGRARYFVIIDVDGRQEEVLVADESAADALADQVVTAAVQLATVRIPLGAMGSEFSVYGHLVLDLGKARRTEVSVQARSMAMATMGIKK